MARAHTGTPCLVSTCFTRSLREMLNHQFHMSPLGGVSGKDFTSKPPDSARAHRAKASATLRKLKVIRKSQNVGQAIDMVERLMWSDVGGGGDGVVSKVTFHTAIVYRSRKVPGWKLVPFVSINHRTTRPTRVTNRSPSNKKGPVLLW